jgi:hypothetical protein
VRAANLLRADADKGVAPVGVSQHAESADLKRIGPLIPTNVQLVPSDVRCSRSTFTPTRQTFVDLFLSLVYKDIISFNLKNMQGNRSTI